MAYNPDLDAGSIKTVLMTLARLNPTVDGPISFDMPAPTPKQSKTLATTFRFRLYATAKKLATSPKSTHIEREAAETFRTNWKISIAEPYAGNKTYSLTLTPRSDDPVNLLAAQLQAKLQKRIDTNRPTESDPTTDQFVLNALKANPDNHLGQYSTRQPKPDDAWLDNWTESDDTTPANPYTQARKDQGNDNPGN